MSIVASALNRLQSEALNVPPMEGSPPTAVQEKSSLSPEQKKPKPPSSKVLRRVIVLGMVVITLSGVGWGAYRWGLSLFSNVGQVSPHRTENPSVPLTPEPFSEEQALVQSVSVPEAETQELESSPVSLELSEISDVPSEEGVPVGLAQENVSQPTSVPVVSSDSARPESGDGQTPTEAIALNTSSLASEGEPSPSPAMDSKNDDSHALGPARNPKTDVGQKTGSLPQSQKERSPPPTASPSTAKTSQLAQIENFINQQEYEKALVGLQPLFVSAPGEWEPWFWRGTAQLGIGQWEQAEESLIEGLARNSNVPQLWIQRALVHQQQGKFGEAVEYLRQAELLAPESPKVQLNLGFSLESQGQKALALDHYRAFLVLTEGQPPYHNVRKKVFERMASLKAS